MIETLISNVSLGVPGETTSVGIESGRFAFIGTSERVAAKWELDACGCLMLPGLIEPHAHIDKSYSHFSVEDQQPETTAETALEQAIVNMAQIKANRSMEDIVERGKIAIERAISKGVCHLRSHIDFSGEEDLAVVESLIGLRKDYTDKIRIQYTLLCSLDTPEQEAAVIKAVEMGADCIGGAPALTSEPEKGIDRAIALAQQLNCPLDLHIDETLDPQSNCLEYLADRVMATDFQLPVIAGHCCSLAFKTEQDQLRIIDKVAQAGIHIVSLPECNLALIGEGQHPAPRGATPIRKLLAGGVNVCAGSDNVQDPFQPWGDYDPLGTACATALVAQFIKPEEMTTPMAMITDNCARAMGISGYGIKPGNPADFCLLRATGSQQAISERALRTWVFFNGQPVVKQTLEQVWIDGSSSKTTLINPLARLFN